MKFSSQKQPLSNLDLVWIPPSSSQYILKNFREMREKSIENYGANEAQNGLKLIV